MALASELQDACNQAQRHKGCAEGCSPLLCNAAPSSVKRPHVLGTAGSFQLSFKLRGMDPGLADGSQGSVAWRLQQEDHLASDSLSALLSGTHLPQMLHMSCACPDQRPSWPVSSDRSRWRGCSASLETAVTGDDRINVATNQSGAIFQMQTAMPIEDPGSVLS